MTPDQLAKSGTEDAHQTALFAWAAIAQKDFPVLRWLHSVPNGGLRSARTGARMKATGARKGVWDVFLPVPTAVGPQGHYCPGLYIEMKKPGKGRLTPEQHEFHAHLEYYGYANHVCFAWDDARDRIIDYVKHMTKEQSQHYRDSMEGTH